MDVAGRHGHIVNIQTIEDGINYTTRSQVCLHNTTRGCGCLEGHFDRPTKQIGREVFIGYEGKLWTVGL